MATDRKDPRGDKTGNGLILSALLCLSLLSWGVTHPLSYEHRRTNDPFSIHIATVRVPDLKIQAVTGGGDQLRRERVSAMAQRRRAVLAVNGGFFRIGGGDDGNPSGILRIDRIWVSGPVLPRGAVGWTEDGREVLIDRVSMEWSVELEDRRLEVAGINRTRGAWEVVAFNSGFGASTGTAAGGTEWVVREGRLTAIERGGNTVIPEDGYIVSFGSRLEAPPVESGARIQLDYRFRGSTPGSEWERMDYIVGGTPLLVKGGSPVQDPLAEKVRTSFVEERHPRTAVGIRNDGTWVFVVVDGRRPEVSVGMTLNELTGLMLDLGCRDALNLDGGGSSTFYLYGEVLNQPSDLAGERPVSDAIIVLEPEPDRRVAESREAD
jgi:hypothetical protein